MIPLGRGAVPSRHADTARVLLVRAAHGRGRGRPCQGLDLPLPRLPTAHRETCLGCRHTDGDPYPPSH